MKDLISSFAQHLDDAKSILANSSLKHSNRSIRNVIITGLGGSGIGGSVAAELVARQASIPVVVNKNYLLPNFVSESTLLIACSYSGNTEETLMATEAAIEKGAQVATITSGGKMMEIAKQKGYNVLSMQGGHPPRSMFAYSFSFLCAYLEHYGIADWKMDAELEASIKLLNNEEAGILVEAERLATDLSGKIPIVYAVSGNLGIASRWRQQLNENAKMLAWEAEIPEMNHNELVGWEGGNRNFAPVFLRNENDFDRNQKRISIIQNIMKEKGAHIHEVWSKGDSNIQRALYLIHFGDWVSYYLSEINEVDILDIKSIDLLKAELSKMPL